MFISGIIHKKGGDVISVEPECKVSDVARLLAERRIGAVLVMDGDEIMGVLSERDVIRGIAISGHAILDGEVTSLMSKTVVTCSLHDHVNDALGLMTSRRIRHLPVVEDGHLAGMISIGDLVHARINEVEHEADALKSYIASG